MSTLTTGAPAPDPSGIDPDVLAAIDPAVLAAALDASRARIDGERAADAAAATIGEMIAATMGRMASLAAAADAAGLRAPDLSGILAAAVTRAAPADPSDLAAIIDPAPAAPAASIPAAGTGRTRRRPDRDWTRIASGSIWTAAMGDHIGRVRIDVVNGVPKFTATTGNRGAHRTATRAVQSACGDPVSAAPSIAGRGRSAATVNGVHALRENVGPDGRPTGARLIDVVTI